MRRDTARMIGALVAAPNFSFNMPVTGMQPQWIAGAGSIPTLRTNGAPAGGFDLSGHQTYARARRQGCRAGRRRGNLLASTMMMVMTVTRAREEFG